MTRDPLLQHPFILLVASFAMAAGGEVAASSGEASYFYPHGFGPPGFYGQFPYKFGVPGTCNLSAQLKWMWRWPGHRYASMVMGGPVIDEKRHIYLTIMHGVRKFDTEGQLLWSWDVDNVHTGYLINTPAIMAGALFNSKTDGSVFALSMETGALLWSRQVESENDPDQGFVAARDGKVIIGVGLKEPSERRNNRVLALDATNGSQLWEFAPTPGVWNFMPLFPGKGEDGTIAFQAWNGAAYRVNLTTGGEIWRSGPDDAKTWFTDGGAALGPNEVLYTVGHMGMQTDIWKRPHKPGSLHAYRISDGKLLWEKKDLKEGVFTWPVVGKLSGDGGPLSVIVGVGTLAGFPMKLGFLLWWALNVLPQRSTWAILVTCLCMLLTMAKRLGSGSLTKHLCRSCCGSVVLIFAAFTSLFFADLGGVMPEWLVAKPRGNWTSPPYEYSLQAYDAETGQPQWRVDLPPYNWVSAKGDEEGFLTRMWFTPKRPIALPSAASHPLLDAQGVHYQGYLDGKFYSVKDWNGDGEIDTNTELCSYDMGASSFTAGPAMAPGMLAVASSDGLFVFSSGT